MNLNASTVWWEQHYASGRDSVLGSSGLLGQYKASFVDEFIGEWNIQSVVDLGCGDGGQISQMRRLPEYVGLDTSQTAIEKCRSRNSGELNKTFALRDDWESTRTFDMAISLDVLYHLHERDVFEGYLGDLFGLAERFVILYTTNEDAPYVPDACMRSRHFTPWVAQNLPRWELIAAPPPFEKTLSRASFFVYNATTA